MALKMKEKKKKIRMKRWCYKSKTRLTKNKKSISIIKQNKSIFVEAPKHLDVSQLLLYLKRFQTKYAI